MKKFIIPLVLMLTLTACEKEYEERNVSYLITGLTNPYTVAWLSPDGVTTTETIQPANDGEVWLQNFTAHQGDILYMFAQFTDKELVPTKFKFRILINGKVFKESFGYDHNIGDTLFRVKRAGVIPY
jgi:hypothetical protein